MTSRPFKHASLARHPRRPSFSRTHSNSSTHSHHSQDLSSFSSTASYFETGEFPAPNRNISSSFSPGQSPLPSPSKPKDFNPQRIGRSRPIAIELPSRRRSGPVHTPPEPLSARGDLPGGYFPLHEEISRSYKPHPFHPDSSYKLSSGLHSPKKMPDLDSPQYTPLGHPASHQPEPAVSNSRLPLASGSLSMTATHPAGMMLLPLGKYHPSQYKNKSTANRSEKSNTDKAAKHHSRQSSDVRRKLLQYQRDMVEQASVAGRISMPMAKPTSPKLLPLGSPGPVTPMALEEGEGYLVAGWKGSSSSSLGSGQEFTGGEAMDAQDMVRMMVEAERERDRV